MKLTEIVSHKRFQKIVKFPGTDKDIVLQILTVQEDQDAQLATERHFDSNNFKGSIGIIPDTYQEERAYQRMSIILRNANKSLEPLATSVDELRKLTTTDQIDFLINEYNEFEKDMSPNPIYLTDNEFDIVLEGLKKNTEAIPLDSFNTNMLKRLIIGLANALKTSQAESGLKSLQEK